MTDQTVLASGQSLPRQVEIMAWLVITKTPSVRTGQIFRLEKIRSHIGRGKEVEIFINDSKAGRTHAAIKYDDASGGTGAQFVLYDLASSNGTYLNGQQLSSPAVLKDGDRIGIGDTELAFKRL
jgi:pSer/pThr/pTyr-binding forkhead associated (FHA) protein